MADIFTIIGVLVIVFGALLFVSWLFGYMTDQCSWETAAWVWSVVISTVIISLCVMIHILKVF